MNSVYHLLGLNVREWRELRHYTQGELGRMTGLSRNTISRIELGKQDVTLDSVWRLCCALQCDVAELVPSVSEYRSVLPTPL